MMEWLPRVDPPAFGCRRVSRLGGKKKALLLASSTYLVWIKKVLLAWFAFSIRAKSRPGANEFSQSTSWESNKAECWPSGIVERRPQSLPYVSYQALSTNSQTSAPGSKVLT